MAQKIVTPADPGQKRGVPKEGLVRIGPLTGLPALVRDLGCDADSLFAGAGFNAVQFDDPDTEVPFVPASRLLARCVEATGCDQLGLLLGERTDPSTLGIAGFMLKVAPDVGSALRDLVRHLDLHDRGAVALLETHGDQTQLGYSIFLSGVEAADQIYDLSMAVICRIMRRLCGKRWSPTEVRLSRRQPQDLKPYRRFFRATVRFETHQNAVVFPSRWLKHPVESTDPLLHRYLEQEAARLHDTLPKSLTGELRRLLRRSLETRKQNAADIARQLGMHERTLNRRLREEGTTFRQELEDIRYEVARQLLADSKMSLSKVAEVLDYSDATSFSRAFKRWSGATPTEWRFRQRGT